ncbi:MAG: tyrosine-protein phosphatase [Steroidobacteraceae bacterium]
MTTEFAAMPNFRDAGGHPTVDGARMRRGFLYRSDHGAALGPDDASRLASLGLRTVFDLRTSAEAAMDPGHTPAGARRVSLDVLADERDGAPARIIAMLSNPRAASAELGDGRAAEMFSRVYRSLVSSPSAVAGWRRFYLGLLDEHGAPALVHCTTGKDRTGWACAALQSLVGVPREAVYGDFLASTPRILGKYRAHLAAFAAAGGDPAVLTPVLGVLPEYLDAAFDEVRLRHGGIEAWFVDGLGLGDEPVAALRELAVERTGPVAPA